MRRAVWAIALASPILLALVLLSPNRSMGSRDLGCANVSGRAGEICRALSASMEWTWMGHAIVSPGWRPTGRGIARVWCALHITNADLSILNDLGDASSDWRLEAGADDLFESRRTEIEPEKSP